MDSSPDSKPLDSYSASVQLEYDRKTISLQLKRVTILKIK